MKKKLPYLISLVLLVLIALNSLRYFTRIDITSTQANSISRVSKELVRDIEETVYIDYYLSDKLRTRSPQTEQIVDILDEYAAFARGKILVDVLDPVTEGISSTVEQLGIAPRQLEVSEEDQTSLALIYSGIAIRYLARTRVIPLIFDPSTLEYQLSSMIRQLVRDDEKVLGILSSPASFSQQNQNIFTTRQELYRALQGEYSVEILSPSEAIPPDIDTLLVIDSDELNDASAFYIDQFIMNGGSTFFALEGIRVTNDPLTGGFTAEPVDSSVLSLLAHYGFTVGQELLLDERNNRIPIVQQTGGFQIQTIVPYEHWVSVGDTVNKNHPITARFAGLDLFWASPLYRDDSILEFTETLISSTEESWLMREDFFLSPQEEYLFRSNIAETKGSYDVAVAFQGPLTYNSALPLPETAEESGVLTEIDTARIIVLSDGDVLGDLMQVTNARVNLDFTLNVLSWLGNDEDLLSIRTRNIRPQTLDKIQDPQLAAVLRGIVRWGNMLVIPLIVALFGVLVMINRRRRT